MEEGSSLHGSNSKSESGSASSSSLNQLRKLLDRARHDVENMPGAELWRSEKIEKAMTMDKEGMSCKKLRKGIALLRAHVTVRLSWLETVRTDPLSLSTGWDLGRFWRFRCAIAWFDLWDPYPLKVEEMYRTHGLVERLWKYMTKYMTRREEDMDVTLDEVSHNLHVFFQLAENTRIKLLEAEAAAALKRQKRRRPPSLRVEVLEKQARRHAGSGVVPEKKKMKKHNSANDGDDDPVPPHLSKLKPYPKKKKKTKKKKKKKHNSANDGDDDPVPPHLYKLKPERIPLRTSKLKPS